jgi:hypothetical protein
MPISPPTQLDGGISHAETPLPHPYLTLTLIGLWMLLVNQ